MRKVNFISFLFACTFAYLFLSSHKIYAQEQFSLGVYPPLMKITAYPPSQVTSGFSLENYSKEQSINLILEIKAFTPSKNFDGHVELIPQNVRLSQSYQDFIGKIQILDDKNNEVKNIILSPTERKSFSLSINLDKNQAPGDYYFSIIALSQPQSQDTSNVSSIIGGVGLNVIFTLGQKEKANGIIQDFSSPIFLLGGPVPFSLLLENTTQNAFSIHGNVLIKNMFGQILGSLSLLPVNILSHSSRFVPDANSGSSTQIVWNERVLFGLYSAKLNVALSEEGPLFTRIIYFIAFPIKAIILAISIVILLIYTTLRIIKRLNDTKNVV